MKNNICRFSLINVFCLAFIWNAMRQFMFCINAGWKREKHLHFSFEALSSSKEFEFMWADADNIYWRIWRKKRKQHFFVRSSAKITMEIIFRIFLLFSWFEWRWKSSKWLEIITVQSECFYFWIKSKWHPKSSNQPNYRSIAFECSCHK